MKIRSDSLHARLQRDNALDDFFAFVAASAPSYQEMEAWLAVRGFPTSLAALHTIVNRHMGAWKIRQALKAAAEDPVQLPPGTDAAMRDRLLGLKFDLAMSDLTVQQQLALLKLDQADRELSAKTETARGLAVQALLAEAEGNDPAQALLKDFLAALDAPAKEAP